MRQLYDTYRVYPKVAPLVRLLPWSHNLLILGRCQLAEEREFYLRMAVNRQWSKRELERQMDGVLFARTVTNPPIVAPVLRQLHPAAETIFKDTYLLDFLELPVDHSERDLQRALVKNLKQFLIELGPDFCFAGEELRLQVGGQDKEVVEYALSRALSPALIAEYQTRLPDRKLLQRKLHEFYQLAMPREK